MSIRWSLLSGMWSKLTILPLCLLRVPPGVDGVQGTADALATSRGLTKSQGLAQQRGHRADRPRTQAPGVPQGTAKQRKTMGWSSHWGRDITYQFHMSITASPIACNKFDCMLTSLFGLTTKKIPMPHIAGPLWGESIGGFPSQPLTGKAESAIMSWPHNLASMLALLLKHPVNFKCHYLIKFASINRQCCVLCRNEQLKCFQYDH